MVLLNYVRVNSFFKNSFCRRSFGVTNHRQVPVILLSNDFPRVSSLQRLSMLRDNVNTQSQLHNLNEANTTGNTGNSDRRVLQLIPKVSERLINNDYSGTIWEAICYEASAISESDPKAATLMSNFILSQPSFESAVIDFVANQLETPLVQATTIRNLFADICQRNPQISSLWALDLMGSAMRDNSQPNAVSVLLFNKGFHSLVTYRIANAL